MQKQHQQVSRMLSKTNNPRTSKHGLLIFLRISYISSFMEQLFVFCTPALPNLKDDTPQGFFGSINVTQDSTCLFHASWTNLARNIEKIQAFHIEDEPSIDQYFLYTGDSRREPVIVFVHKTLCGNSSRFKASDPKYNQLPPETNSASVRLFLHLHWINQSNNQSSHNQKKINQPLKPTHPQHPPPPPETNRNPPINHPKNLRKNFPEANAREDLPKFDVPQRSWNSRNGEAANFCFRSQTKLRMGNSQIGGDIPIGSMYGIYSKIPIHLCSWFVWWMWVTIPNMDPMG